MALCSLPPSIEAERDQNEFYWHTSRSAGATSDWLGTRHDTISGGSQNKVANTAVSSPFLGVNASIEYADSSEISFGQCFITEPIPLSEPELEQSTTLWALFLSDNDALGPDRASQDICVENSPTLFPNHSPDSVWPWTKLGESEAAESELLEDEYQNASCAARHASSCASRTPSIVSSESSVRSSPVPGSPSEKSRSRTPECKRDRRSSTSSDRKRKPKDQARISHAKVERRYRDNLNTKILQLQECLDRSKRACPGYGVGPESIIDEYLDKDVRGAGKALRKADILSEAIRYINETEVEMRHISNELYQLRSQFATLQAKSANRRPQR